MIAFYLGILQSNEKKSNYWYTHVVDESHRYNLGEWSEIKKNSSCFMSVFILSKE